MARDIAKTISDYFAENTVRVWQGMALPLLAKQSNTGEQDVNGSTSNSVTPVARTGYPGDIHLRSRMLKQS